MHSPLPVSVLLSILPSASLSFPILVPLRIMAPSFQVASATPVSLEMFVPYPVTVHITISFPISVPVPIPVPVPIAILVPVPMSVSLPVLNSIIKSASPSWLF
mmetsp:Transcript_61101/g.108992  ORF Transcript_61101/g.108992 Transcript_61101/m.108992 type:complete len:103 (-) Transcript_61101:564-872(-)